MSNCFTWRDIIEAVQEYSSSFQECQIILHDLEDHEERINDYPGLLDILNER